MKLPFLGILQRIAGFFSSSGSSPIIDIPSGGSFVVRIGGVEAFRVDGSGAAIPAGRSLGMRGATASLSPRFISNTNRVLTLVSADSCIIDGGGVRSDTSLSANQNNYAVGNGPSFLSRLGSTTPIDITGHVAYGSSSLMFIVNAGSNNITFKHEDANSTAANRFICNTGADIVLGANEMLLLMYDSGSSRWRIQKL